MKYDTTPLISAPPPLGTRTVGATNVRLDTIFTSNANNLKNAFLWLLHGKKYYTRPEMRDSHIINLFQGAFLIDYRSMYGAVILL